MVERKTAMPNGSNFLNVNRPDELSTAVELLNTVRRERLKYFPSPIDWRDEVLYFLRPRVFTVAVRLAQRATTGHAQNRHCQVYVTGRGAQFLWSHTRIYRSPRQRQFSVGW